MVKKRKLALRESIGIDIGESAIKVVKLKATGREPLLQNYGLFPTPKGSLERGTIKDPDLLEGAIAECLHDAKIKRGKAVLGLSGKDIVVRISELPMMSREELKEAVGWDLTQYISYSLEEAVYDYYVIGTKVENGVERLRLLVAAAPLELINRYIKILSSVGMTLIAIEVKSLALTRIFPFQNIHAKGVYVIIDIGASTTSLVVMRDGEFLFLRDALLGGRDFTQAIMKGFNVSEEEAESIKKRLDNHPEKEKIYSTISSVMDEFVLEITRSLSYFRENIANVNTFDRLFLTGGGSKLSGFSTYLESGIGIKTDILDPFAGIKQNLSKDGGIGEIKELLSTAIGLSKRGFEGE